MFDPIEEVVAALAAGEIVVLTDDENRENEGDLICAGAFATPRNINFMVTHGRGVLCVPVDVTTAERLSLAVPPGRHDPRGTAFSQSLDAVSGTTTGVSAFDRSRTIAEIMRPSSSIDDFYSPGHVYPLLARPAGVLERTGHTEGTVDLVKMAGLPPVGVLCEILKDDGTMARLPDLQVFRRRHGLKLCSIAAIVEYRTAQETC
ncbi:MAG: 3,4-dihydroxy-2-butanone-4-phosphate synthase [Victivallaceae bacterium]